MKRLITLSILLAALVFAAFAFTGCSPGYVMRAALEQSRILVGREPISQVISDSRTPADERTKLTLVLGARAFSETLGLTPKRTFTQFARIKGNAVAWVISGSKKDRFEFHRWWFPIAGSMPYKGFFEKDDAIEGAAELEKAGYETWVRGTEAFSTLGWFNDPLLSTTLKNTPAQIVNTVLHETLHTTLWIPNHVDFNESLANFVGHQGAIEFFESLSRGEKYIGVVSCELIPCQEHLDLAKRQQEREYAIGDAIEQLYSELKELYDSDKPTEDKLTEREAIFSRITDPLRAKFPQLRILQKVNNAEILQLWLYLRGLRQFETRFRQLGGNWKLFLDDMRDISKAVEKGKNPYSTLAAKIEADTATIAAA